MDPKPPRRTGRRPAPAAAPAHDGAPGLRGTGGANTANGGSAGTVARLRQLIAEGGYAAGERLAEEAVAAALGVSRTPVRLAFRTLAQEGLLQPAGKRGHVVREFSAEDVLVAVEVRGVLEGLAARRLAEQGLGEEVRATLHECLAEGERVVAAARLTEQGIARWSALNARFHAAIVGMGGRSRVIADAIARNNHLPFASADSITVQKSHLAAELRKLQMAQMQHRLVVEALEQRESARVEALMREHAYVGFRYGHLFGAAVAMPAHAAPERLATAGAAAAPAASKARRPARSARSARARPPRPRRTPPK